MRKWFATVGHQYPVLSQTLRKQKESVLEHMHANAYEAPAVLETFDALEVMGAAEGFEVYLIGNGSAVAQINIPR